MYLMQAINLVEGIPQTDTGYIYNPDFARNGPQTYPVGYPILLSPIIAIWGNDMAALSMYQSVLAVIFGLSLFAFLRRKFTAIFAIVGTAILVYNPWFLFFKRELMSDIPFATATLWYLMSLESRKDKLAGFFALIMILLRGIGWIAVPILFVPVLSALASGKNLKENLIRSGAIAGSVTVSALILVKLAFNIPSSTEAYADQLLPQNILDNMLGNLTYFYEVLNDHLFRYFEDQPIVFNALLIIYLTLAVIGIFESRNKLRYHIWFLLLYLMIILVYPYRFSGFRFILPIHGIMILFSGIGAYRILKSTAFRHSGVFMIALAYMSTHLSWWKPMVANQGITQPGPQHPSSLEFFEFIKQDTGAVQPILFNKPRVLNLYTGKSSVSNETWSDGSEIPALIEKFDIQDIAICTDLPHPGLSNFINENVNSLSVRFENDKFTFYHLDLKPK